MAHTPGHAGTGPQPCTCSQSTCHGSESLSPEGEDRQHHLSVPAHTHIAILGCSNTFYPFMPNAESLIATAADFLLCEQLIMTLTLHLVLYH